MVDKGEGYLQVSSHDLQSQAENDLLIWDSCTEKTSIAWLQKLISPCLYFGREFLSINWTPPPSRLFDQKSEWLTEALLISATSDNSDTTADPGSLLRDNSFPLQPPSFPSVHQAWRSVTFYLFGAHLSIHFRNPTSVRHSCEWYDTEKECIWKSKLNIGAIKWRTQMQYYL